jgi:hypothetical protein
MLSAGFVAVLATSLVRVQTAAPPDAAVPTYSKDVAPIVYDKCTMCHRPGEVAPMTLLSYEDVRPWARVIRNKVVAREMPPWGADPEPVEGTDRDDHALGRRRRSQRQRCGFTSAAHVC